jgi:uncharacterized protein YecT (DUF1311 family)
MFGKDYQPCGDQPNTVAIVECTNAKTKLWDQRLNAAYKALGQIIDPAQRDPLKAGQRLWIEYRDANCKFYGSHEGTISQVMGAECVRSMTQDRAMELEEAAKP